MNIFYGCLREKCWSELSVYVICGLKKSIVGKYGLSRQAVSDLSELCPSALGIFLGILKSFFQKFLHKQSFEEFAVKIFRDCDDIFQFHFVRVLELNFFIYIKLFTVYFSKSNFLGGYFQMQNQILSARRYGYLLRTYSSYA